MRLKQTDGMCLGAVRLASIDTGFDARQMPVRLPDDPATVARMADGDDDEQTGVGFDGSDGSRYVAWGTPEEIRGVLTEHGYSVA